MKRRLFSSLFGGLSSICLFALTLSTAAPVMAQSDASASKVRPLITAKIDDAKLVTLEGNVRPEALNPSYDRGAVADDFAMSHLWLQLKRSPEQEKALVLLNEQLKDPKSPNYHKWLTAEQFGQTFGLAQADLDKITSWLEAQGFKVDAVFPNRMVIEFSGTAGDVSGAFHTEIHKLNVRGVDHIANVSDPKIPAALAPAVLGVVSLNNFKPQQMHEVRAPKYIDPATGEITTAKPSSGAKPEYTSGSGTSTEYSLVPGDAQTIYNITPIYTAGYTGTGQTIAVIEDSDDFTDADFTTFRSTFGLATTYPNGNLITVQPSGTATCTDPGDTGDGTDFEVELDAEMATAIAPDATVEIASCADTSTVFGGLIAIQNLVNGKASPPVLSMSYGECEAVSGATLNASFSSIFQQAATEGISVFVSSGDDAGAGCEQALDTQSSYATHGLNITGWGESAYNVSVGGTDFQDTALGTNSTYWNSTNSATFESAKSYIPEIPWDDSCASSILWTLEKSTSGTVYCNTSGGHNFLNYTGGGGGASSCYSGTATTSGVTSGSCAGLAKPSWQSGVVGIPADGVRDIPDVSLFAANGLYGHFWTICYSNTSISGGAVCTGAPSTWTGAGGTSSSTPVMAAIQLLIDQKYGDQGNPNPEYYSLAATEYGASGNTNCNSNKSGGPASTCTFYDITAGDDDVDCRALSTTLHNCYLPSSTYGVLSTSNSAFADAYASKTGYDLTTGIGSVNAANLFNAWPAGGISGTKTGTSMSVSASPNPVTKGTSTVITAQLSWPTGATPTGTISYSVDFGTGTVMSCTGTTSPITCTATLATTALAGGPHTITAYYAGNSTYYPSDASTTLNVNLIATTTTVSVTPGTQTYGTSTPQSVSGTVSWAAGSSSNPTLADITFTSSAGGSFSTKNCVVSGSQYNCTSTFTPTATDAPGNYFIELSFSGDSNYASSNSGTGTNFVVNKQTPTLSVTTVNPGSQTYGTSTAQSVTATATWTSGGTAPTKADFSFSSTAGGSFSTINCTGTTSYTCTSTFTPSATDAGGQYNIVLNFSGDTRYAATTSPQTNNFTVNTQAMTFGAGSVTPTSVAYSVSQSVALSQAVTWTGSGSAPASANFSFTLNSVNYPATCTVASKTYTCKATVPAATVAALAVAGSPYTVTFGFTSDGNYTAISGHTVGTLAITADSDSVTVSPAPTSIGPGGSSVVTITMNNTQASATSTPAGSVSLVDTSNGNLALGGCTLSSGSCTINVPAASLKTGANTLTATYAASPANWASPTTGTGTLTLTGAPTTSISLTPATTGSTTTGVTTATLTANIVAASNDGLWGGTVTFTNTTTGATYHGTVTGSGTTGSASVTITEPDSGTAGGLNNYTATYAGTANYQGSGPSNSVAVYWQGLLISSVLPHDFSGKITYGSSPAIAVEGTIDGTKLGPYGVTVYNFTAAAQTVGVNFTNAASGAFSYVTNCPASLAAGKTCNIFYYYAPPSGDGCNPYTNCTIDTSVTPNLPQGTYEAGSWAVTSSATLGVGDSGFDRSGPAVFPATLAGKAVLPTGSLISVSPLSYSFGPLAPNELSNTLTITVTNASAASVGLAYTGPTTAAFQATNFCPATLAGNATCTVNVTFEAGSANTYTDSVKITPTGGTPVSVALTGIVDANTGLQLSTIAHNFGNASTGQSAGAFGLSITNHSTSAATLSFGTSQTGTTPYNVVTSGCPSSLAAGAQCSVVVNFTPASVGTFSDVLTITSSVPILPDGTTSSPYTDTVTFSGAGVAGGQFTASSAVHNWGTLPVGTAGTNYGVQLTNTTATALTLNLGAGFTSGQNGFTLAGTNCGSTLAVNASCELIFSFTPAASGAVSASYGVSATDTGNNPINLFSGGTIYTGIALSGAGQ